MWNNCPADGITVLSIRMSFKLKRLKLVKWFANEKMSVIESHNYTPDH